MATQGKSFSIVRLNQRETGYGVVDDASGALVHIDGLALRLTKERADAVAAQLNAEAKERDQSVCEASSSDPDVGPDTAP